MTESERAASPIPEDANQDSAFSDMLTAIFDDQRARGGLQQPPPVGRDIFQDESDRLFIGRELTLDQFRSWYAVQGLGTMPFNAVGYHHTEVPDHRIWAGMPSLRGIFNYYRDELGWEFGVGPHIWVYSGDGPYSQGSPRVYIGTHPAHDGIGIAGRNRRWLHIEHIWNGDRDLFSEAMKNVSGQVLAIVCSPTDAANRQIPLTFISGPGTDNPDTPLGIMYHRDQNPNWPGDGGWPKSCPGSKISHDNLDRDLIAFATSGNGVISSTDFMVGQRLLVDSGPLNLRSAPGRKFAILAELEQGAEVTAIEGPFEIEGHRWYRVSGPPDGPGWVAGDFLRIAP
ncbi:MAG: SH3 domain-containing protein [Thermomicrobiales bacterium]